MKEALVKAYHWVLVAVGLASLASAAAGPSPNGAQPAPTPTKKPLGRALLAARGLQRRLEQEPDLAGEILSFAESKGWSDDHLDHFLAAVGNIESEWNPQAQNPYTKATGLIQFMPSTARALGTSIEELFAMTAVEQMAFVRKFFASYKNLAPRDIYPAIFYPAVIGKSDGTVIFSRGQTGYTQNQGLDKNGDGAITAGDIRSTVDAAVFSLRQKPRIVV